MIDDDILLMKIIFTNQMTKFNIINGINDDNAVDNHD